MKTSNFKTYKGDKGIAVCIRAHIDFQGDNCRELNPRKQDFWDLKGGQIDHKEYEKLYREFVLAKLDPKEILKRFSENVLLCWEPPGDFCHRRVIADWIFEELEIEVPEWKSGDDDLKNESKALF